MTDNSSVWKNFCERKNMVSRLFRVQICGIYDVFLWHYRLVFPYQAEWVSIHESIKTYGIYTMIYLLGFSFYSQMFTSYKGSKRNRNLGEILQNLPVSSVQIAIFKAKKT